MRRLLFIGLMAVWTLPVQMTYAAVADYGGSRGTYLKFELEKVSIVSIEFHGIGAAAPSPVLHVSGLPSHVEVPVKPAGPASKRMTGKRGPVSERMMRKRGPASERTLKKRGPASARLTGRRQHKPIVFRKRVDGTTPVIQKALSRRQVVPRLVLHGRDRTTGKRIKIVLHGVRIQSQRRLNPRMALKARGGQEEIVVRYDRLTVQNIGSSGQDG